MNQLQINSASRQEYTLTTPSNFKIPLDKKVAGSWELTYLNFQNTMYQINDNNKTFIYYDTVLRTCTLPIGYYTSTTLCAQVVTSMNALTGPGTYSIILNPVTNRMTLTSTGTFYLDFTQGPFVLTAPSTQLGQILGFGNIQVPNQASGLTLVGTATGTMGVNVNWNIIMYITINNIRNIRILKYDGTESAASFSFSPGMSLSLGTADYKPQGRDQFITFIEDPQSLTITVRNIMDQYVDFNGADWGMILQRCRKTDFSVGV
jgi:hypothetical protein